MVELSPLEMIQRNAQLVIDSTYQQFGVTLGYDEDSVEWLDEHIEQLRDKNYPANDIAMLVNVLGSFYGECIRRQFGGEWQEYKGGFMLAFANGQMVSPFGKIMKQFEKGASSGESVKSYYTSIPRLFPNLHKDSKS